MELHFPSAAGTVAEIVDGEVREEGAVDREVVEKHLRLLGDKALGLAVEGVLDQLLEGPLDVLLGGDVEDVHVHLLEGVLHHLGAAE